MTFVDPLELELIEAGDPRFVRPSGETRYTPTSCAVCRRPTLAIRGPLCPSHQTFGVCGHDYGEDPHIEPDGRTFCPNCCRRPGCNPVSTPTTIGVDAATGVPDAPAPVGSAQDAAPVAAPLADKE